jgi:hypothetical protein
VTRRTRFLLVVAAGAVLIVAGALAFGRRDRGDLGVERRALEAQCWDYGTKTVDPAVDPAVQGWREASERVSYFCDVAVGAGLTRAVFPDERGLRRALLRAPPPGRLCLDGLVVLLDSLDSGFEALCRRVGGIVFDAARRLPEPTGLSMDEIDRNGRAYDRRASALQRRALAAHWARTAAPSARG